MGRKKLIIEAAIKLFAQKGYHATSMQEIAENSGMAKGSLYNHFKSKEELALSIFQYYYDLVFEKIAQLDADNSLTPRDKFIHQLTLQLREFYRNKDFIQMQMSDQAMGVNEGMNEFQFKMRAEMLRWYYDSIIDIYGEAIRPYALDCSTILSGILQGYLQYIIMDRKEIDIEKLPRFVMDRLDFVVDSFLTGAEQLTILTDEAMADYMEAAKAPKVRLRGTIIEAIEDTKLLVQDHSTIVTTLSALADEFADQHETKKVVVDALLMMLATYEADGLDESVAYIKQLIERYMQ